CKRVGVDDCWFTVLDSAASIAAGRKPAMNNAPDREARDRAKNKHRHGRGDGFGHGRRCGELRSSAISEDPWLTLWHPMSASGRPASAANDAKVHHRMVATSRVRQRKMPKERGSCRRTL